MFKKKKKLTAAEQEYANRMTSFQEHLPIEDISNRLFKDKNNCYYPAFKMGEKTLDLMTLPELDAFSKQVQITFASMNLDGCQFLTVPTPFDLTPYKKNQEKQIERLRMDINRLRNKVSEYQNAEGVVDFEYLQGDSDAAKAARQIKQYELYIEYINAQTKFITEMLKSGLAAHKECIVIPVIHDNWNATTVEEAALNIETKLKSIASDSHRCSEQEMRDILYSILNPMRKDTYRVPPTQYTPTL